MPARQSFLIELVGKEDLMDAISLNSAVFNLSRTIGPAIAGIVMKYWGIAACFLINSISFGAVVISLFFIKPMHINLNTNKEESIFKNIADGLKYIYRNKILFVTILIMSVVGTFAPNFNVLVPVFSIQVLNQNETGYGLLMSCMGIGAFIGAMLIAATSKSGPKKFLMFIVPLIVGALLIVTGLTRTYTLTGISLAITGLVFVMFTSNANSTMQINSDNEYLGRVMSVYSLVFAGSTPIGNLYAGAIAEHLSASMGFVACGAIILILMVPIYLYLIQMKKHKTNINAGEQNE